MNDETPEAAVEAMARALHDAYEDAAVLHGWSTQERSRVPFDQLPEANRLTMLDACGRLIAQGWTPPGGTE